MLTKYKELKHSGRTHFEEVTIQNPKLKSFRAKQIFLLQIMRRSYSITPIVRIDDFRIKQHILGPFQFIGEAPQFRFTF